MSLFTEIRDNFYKSLIRIALTELVALAASEGSDDEAHKKATENTAENTNDSIQEFLDQLFNDSQVNAIQQDTEGWELGYGADGNPIDFSQRFGSSYYNDTEFANYFSCNIIAPENYFSPTDDTWVDSELTMEEILDGYSLKLTEFGTILKVDASGNYPPEELSKYLKQGTFMSYLGETFIPHIMYNSKNADIDKASSGASTVLDNNEVITNLNSGNRVSTDVVQNPTVSVTNNTSRAIEFNTDFKITLFDRSTSKRIGVSDIENELRKYLVSNASQGNSNMLNGEISHNSTSSGYTSIGGSLPVLTSGPVAFVTKDADIITAEDNKVFIASTTSYGVMAGLPVDFKKSFGKVEVQEEGIIGGEVYAGLGVGVQFGSKTGLHAYGIVAPGLSFKVNTGIVIEFGDISNKNEGNMDDKYTDKTSAWVFTSLRSP